MKTTIFLRIAAVLTLIHAALHTIGGVFGQPAPGAAAQMAAAMKASHFLWLGNQRTYWDFLMGMGLGLSIFLTASAVVFWLLASLAGPVGAKLRPVLLVFVLCFAALAVDSFRYFFLGAVALELLIALCLALALVAAGRNLPRGLVAGGAGR